VRSLNEPVSHPAKRENTLRAGQTGAGKTHSLLHLGEGGDASDAGLVPRLAVDLFARIAADVSHSYEVHVAMVQIYNEVCDDLLVKNGAGACGDRVSALQASRGMKVVQTPGCLKDGGWEMEGLSWYRSKSPEQLLEYFTNGRKRIVYAETHMNKHSSRSHCLLQLRVNKVARTAAPADASAAAVAVTAAAAVAAAKKNVVQQSQGLLTVVDLAGSERVKKSGAMNMTNRFREATAINGSLLVLGQVVQSLAKRQKHIPYRDSVLTKLLETSLSGKSRTALLVCAAAELEHAGESTTTMEFAARCMRVEAAPVARIAFVEVDPASLARDLAASVLDSSGHPAGAAAELMRSGQEIRTLTNSLAKEREAREAEEAKLKARAVEAESEAAAVAAATRERERDAAAALEKARESAAAARGDAAQAKAEALDTLRAVTLRADAAATKAKAEALDKIRAESSRADAVATELAAERNAAAAAAAAAASAAAKEREAARHTIAALEVQLAAERTRMAANAVEIPRLTESVCSAGAKIMELSDRIAQSERARVELSQRLGETEVRLATFSVDISH
jgi:hypothetical protein